MRRSTRILLVDDDDVFLEVIDRALDKSALDCVRTFATSLTDAMQSISTTNFDCILLDHKLGDGDAFAILEHLQGVSDKPPVVMLSNNDDVDIAVRAMKFGVTDFISKGDLSGEKLKSSIEKGIDERNLERASEKEKSALLRMSFYDELTGLANRNLITDRLAQSIKAAERNAKVFAIFMMDLNLFKDVNDAYGHDAGDEVLRITSQRLKKCLRSTDTIGRQGGDEFVAILDGTESIDGAIVGARKIIRAMSQPFNIAGNQLSVGLSIGIALYPENGTDAASLMKAADIALYDAKEDPSNFCIASDPESTKARHQKQIATALQSDDMLNEIQLEYQPILEFGTTDVSSVEALARWKNVKFGTLLPLDFIPALERTEAILKMTLRTLDIAFTQSRQWCDLGISLPISLNISKRMLTEAKFPSYVQEKLTHYGVVATTINFEFSQFFSLKNQHLAMHIINELSEMGVRVSIGDFGAGNPSYQNLKAMPLHEIKLDQSFITNLIKEKKDRSIIRSVAVLAEGLDCDLVAVGIENLATWEQLIALGCRKGQGYYFAPPMNAEELLSWRQQWRKELEQAYEDPQVLRAIRQA